MSKRTKKNKRQNAKAWLVSKNISMRAIQLALGHRSITQVSETLQGNRNDRNVLMYLKKIGCPIKFLDLPADMVEEK